MIRLFLRQTVLEQGQEPGVDEVILTGSLLFFGKVKKHGAFAADIHTNDPFVSKDRTEVTLKRSESEVSLIPVRADRLRREDILEEDKVNRALPVLPSGQSSGTSGVLSG